jgi:hypothetical protein
VADDEEDIGSADPDRAAILERRRRFLLRALEGVRPVGIASTVAAIAASGITAACQPCLSVVGPQDTETGCDSESGSDSETGCDSETGTDETASTETDTGQ